MVPIRHTTYETELTVGSGIRCISFEQFDGGTDLGYNRMNFRWGNVGTFQISPGSHMWQVANKYYKEEEPIPMTMCFGVPPACTLLAGAGFDYVILPWAATRSALPARCRARRSASSNAARSMLIRLPMPRSCSRAMSIRAIAATRPRSGEGRRARPLPFPSRMGGLYGQSLQGADVSRHRRDHAPAREKPIIFALGVHTLDDHNIDTTVREAAIFELCERLQPGIVQDVVIPYCMTDWGGCIIQVKKRHQIDEGWQRNFLGAACRARRACGSRSRSARTPIPIRWTT